MVLGGLSVDARDWPHAIVLYCAACPAELTYDGNGGDLMSFLDAHDACDAVAGVVDLSG